MKYGVSMDGGVEDVRIFSLQVATDHKARIYSS